MRLGQRHSPESIQKMRAAKLGNQNHLGFRHEFKPRKDADELSYTGVHSRVRRTAMADICAHADDTCEGELQAALVRGRGTKLTADGTPYSPNVGDYIALCISHHVRYDRRSA